MSDDYSTGSERQGQRHERRRWPREPHGGETKRPLGPPALTPLRFSTRDLPPKDQFEAWRAYVEPLVDIKLPDDKTPADGFPADHTAWNLGGVILVQQHTPAYSYMRSAKKLRSSPIDHWQVSFLRHGRTWTEVDRRVAGNEPGKAVFGSLGHPFRGRTTDAEAITIYMPQDLFADAPGIPEAANNSVLSGNLASLLIDYVNSLEAALHSLAAEELSGVVHSLRDMMITCLSSAIEQGEGTERQVDAGLMVRARQHIRRNLNSPDTISPEALANTLGISRTRLYQLFEASGGVLQYIRRRRLAAAHAALSDPTNSKRILEIAQEVGFDSPASFSRAFSQEFGYSPRQARKTPFPYASFQPLPGGTPSFDLWLATLGS